MSEIKMSLIAKNLNYLFKQKGLNANKVQVLTNKDITQVSIFRILKGETESPRDELVEKLAEFLEVEPHELRYTDLELDSKNNTGLIINGNNTNNGTQIGTQNNLSATFVNDETQEIGEQLNLKSLPLFDIDDGVIYALSSDDSNEIIERAKPSTAFIKQESKAFGVRILYDLVGITNSPICTGDVLLVEPKIPPRNGDLVLLCLGYPDNKRGVIARLYVDMMDNYSVQSDHNPAQPMPSNAVICGVVTDVTRNLIDSSIVQTRLNKDYRPIK